MPISLQTIQEAIHTLLEKDVPIHRDTLQRGLNLAAEEGTINAYRQALHEYLDKHAHDRHGKQKAVVPVVRAWLTPVQLSEENEKLLIEELQKKVPNVARIKEILQGVSVLYLGHKRIGNTGVEVLAKALKGNSSLIYLNLMDNNIGAIGAAALAKSLEDNTSLIYLELGLNDIKDAGAVALAKVLNSITSLASLELWANSIGGSGAAALAKVLNSNTSLAFLNLSGNFVGNFTNTGAEAFAKALNDNTSLTSLKLGENGIRASGAKVLAKALESNYTLLTLTLGKYCEIEHTEEEHLISGYLKRNNALLKKRFIQVTRYFEDSFTQELFEVSTLPSVLAQIVKTCLTPRDFMSQSRDDTNNSLMSSSHASSSSSSTTAIPSSQAGILSKIGSVFTSLKPDSKETTNDREDLDDTEEPTRSNSSCLIQ